MLQTPVKSEELGFTVKLSVSSPDLRSPLKGAVQVLHKCGRFVKGYQSTDRLKRACTNYNSSDVEQCHRSNRCMLDDHSACELAYFGHWLTFT